MKNIRRNTIVLVVFLSLVFALSFGQSQAADKVVLKGTYAVVGENICIDHWTQSSTPGEAPAAYYWTKTETFQGEVTFNPDGTGVSIISVVIMTHPIYTPIPTGPYWWPIPTTLPYGSITTYHLTSQFTYTIDPVTRLITRTTIGTPVGQFTTGAISGYPALGKWFTFSTPLVFVGYVSKNLKTIVLASAPDDEYGDHYITTANLYNDQGMTSLFAVEQDVCQRTRVLTLIEK